MIKTRHFKALMKKNWLVWLRTIEASLCELACPMILMGIICMARALIKPTDIAASSQMSTSVLMAPLAPTATFMPSGDINALFKYY